MWPPPPILAAASVDAARGGKTRVKNQGRGVFLREFTGGRRSGAPTVPTTIHQQ
jgi:hypothetical protein